MNKVAPSSGDSLPSIARPQRRSVKSINLQKIMEPDDDDDVQEVKTKPSSTYLAAHGPTLRAILPQIINEQNRKTFGTWQRQFDFTRTIIGYILGIHNFFRFPYLCYKYGGVFFIPYVLMMLLVGIPTVFMEFTIGQYYGVGSYVAFTHMAPILSGVSKLLTWSSVVNCWMYTVILAWLRVYSNDATSCLKGWEICEEKHYYNTAMCFTGALDDECNDFSMSEFHGLDLQIVMSNEMLYYNFGCQTLAYYCEANGWTAVPGRKVCVDDMGKRHTIYERRYHATKEYLYGAVLGLQRNMEIYRSQVLIQITRKLTNDKNVSELVKEIYESDPNPHRVQIEIRRAELNPKEAVRSYLAYLKTNSDPEKRKLYTVIKDIHMNKQYQMNYWKSSGQRMLEDKESASYKEFQQLSMTTWVMIAVFLFEDLLKISFLSYVLNAVPFIILIYVTTIAVYFDYSGYGIEHIFSLKDGFFTDLARLDLWAEAVIQVIYTTGIGNGVLISLATFNNLNHNYNVDLYCTMSLAIITSLCGVLITFCSLGEYLKQHAIDVPFREYIQAESSSSVDFGMITISILLTLISDQNITIILFFFMLTSFATDSAIRLVQSVLDTVMDTSVRFKHHATMVLVAVCVMGYLILVPMMKNGSFVLFVDFEYFTLMYMMPTIVLIEIGTCNFVYKASRLLDHSEQMGIFSSYSFRVLMMVCMYFSFFAVLVTVIINVINHTSERFNGVEHEALTERFGWLFISSPLLMVLLSVIKQLIVVPSARWHWLLMPLKGKDRKVRRAFLRRIQGGVHADHEDTTAQDEIRDAAMQWRKLESQLVLAMMEKRREEKRHENHETAKHAKIVGSEKNTLIPSTPALVHLVKIAAAAKKEDDELFGGNRPSHATNHNLPVKNGDDDDDDEDEMLPNQKKLKARGGRRLAFIHVKKDSCWSKVEAAFMGKALISGKYYRPKRHTGGGTKTRIVTRQSASGDKVMHLEEEDDDGVVSYESMMSHDDEDGDEKLRENYLDGMDYVERWPGRLDESDIESEGSSLESSDEEGDDAF